MTIEEFGKIINNDNAIREEYLNAEKKGNVDGFFKKHGVDATAETLKELYREKNKYILDDSELEGVAGGVDTTPSDGSQGGKKPTEDAQPVIHQTGNYWWWPF